MLTARKIAIAETVDARKEKIEKQQAWDILSNASEVLIAKGKKILPYTPGPAEKEIILGAALGRSGTLRAPTVKIGKKLLVGFNEELYTDHL